MAVLPLRALGLLALVVVSEAILNGPPTETTSTGLTLASSRTPAPKARSNDIHARAQSPDPACPDGWLCDPVAECPSDKICGDGSICVTFQDTQPLYVCVPADTRWCAFNPSTRIIRGTSNLDAVCCHGDYAPQGTTCCDWPNTKCTLSDNFCGACPAGSTCSSDSCLSDTPTTVTTATPTPTPSPTVTNVPTPTIVQTAGNYTYLGCFVDSSDNRVLDGESFSDGSATGVTVEECVEFAVANGWKYAGVEFGSECHVGNTLNSQDQMVDGDCSMLCAGDVSQFCGEGGRIQIYENKNLHLPTGYAAFGDSYSAGIGAGRFLTTSTDGRDNECARMDGSYPYLLAQMDPFEVPTTWRDFHSCSGAVLNDIDGQIARLQGKRVDVATLSISGNDFGFAKVVRTCVYPTKTIGTGYQVACDEALNVASQIINNPATWDTYRAKANRILNEVLSDRSLLLITGYAKFFATPQSNDVCDNMYFLDKWYGRALKMTAANRVRMNILVDSVNSKIQSEVVARVGTATNVAWIDIDKNFIGHRFCEPANNDDPAGRGAKAHNVWFNDIWTELDETGTWTPAFTNPDMEVWDEWTSSLPANITDDPDFHRGITDKYQQGSIFHPKRDANRITAADINLFIYRWFE